MKIFLTYFVLYGLLFYLSVYGIYWLLIRQYFLKVFIFAVVKVEDVLESYADKNLVNRQDDAYGILKSRIKAANEYGPEITVQSFLIGFFDHDFDDDLANREWKAIENAGPEFVEINQRITNLMLGALCMNSPAFTLICGVPRGCPKRVIFARGF